MANCQTIQEQLLSLGTTVGLPEPLAAHVQSCGSCRSTFRRVRQLDRLLAQLPTPIPNPQRRDALIAQFDGDVTTHLPLPILLRQQSPFPWQLAGTLAAAVLFIGIAVGVWHLGGPSQSQTSVVQAGPDPLLDKLVRQHVDLAVASSAQDRLVPLLALAEELRMRTQELVFVAPAKDLASLASLYEQVIERGVVPQAEQLAQVTPERIRQIAMQLASSETMLRQLLAEAPPASIDPLKKMADSAQEGDQRLRRFTGKLG